LEIAYHLLGDDLVLRVNKAGVQVFGVVLESAGKAMTAKQLLELKTENSDLVVTVGSRADTAREVGYRLGRMANKLIKATREKMNKR
jgi:glycerol dehydrogenase-like iron-containing ADH family enzyme